MQRVNYALPGYPELSFTTQVEGLLHYNLKSATVKAEGPVEAIQVWWQDMKLWCAEQADCALVNRVIHADYSDIAIVTFGSSPEVLVAFIVQWLGLDWLEWVLLDSPPNTPPAADLKAILDRLTAIEDTLSKNYQQTAVVAYRLWAASQALQSKPVQLPSGPEPERAWDEAPNN